MSFNGDLYPTAGADVVMTTKGDMVDYNTARQRLAIGSTNQILQVKSALPSWETVDLADTVLTTAGDVLYENNTPELARLPKGSDADVLTLASGLPSWSAPAGGGTWSTLASTKLTSSGTTIDVTFTAKEYLLFQVRLIVTSASSAAIRYRFNSITTSTYDYNYSLNGAGSATTLADTMINPAGVDFTASDEGFLNVWVHNVAAENKTGLSHFMSKVTTCTNSIGSILWNETSNAITSAQFLQDTSGYPSGEWDVGSEVVVLGYDP